MRPVIKFTELNQLSSTQVNSSAVVPIVQDNQNYILALSALQLGNSVYVQNTVPASPPAKDGDLWFDITTGDFYVFYEDVDSGQWVDLHDGEDVTVLWANSGNWNSTYTTVQAESAGWVSYGDLTGVIAASGNWDSTYSTVQAESAGWVPPTPAATNAWDRAYTTVRNTSASWDSHADLTDVVAASGDWNNTYSTVLAESANWSDHADLTDIIAASGNWDSTYTTVQTESAGWADHFDATEVQAASSDWNSTYSTVLAESAGWDSHADLTDIASASGDWQSTYSTVLAESAGWDSHSDLTDIIAASGDWNSTYTSVNTASADWDDTRTTVQAGSSYWRNNQQTITAVASALDLDVTLGESAVTTLTTHITSFTISNALSGDSGLVIISSDGGGWTFPADVYPSLVMAGDLADIATLTNGVSSRITIGWYHDGQYNYLYVSNSTI